MKTPGIHGYLYAAALALSVSCSSPEKIESKSNMDVRARVRARAMNALKTGLLSWDPPDFSEKELILEEVAIIKGKNVQIDSTRQKIRENVRAHLRLAKFMNLEVPTVSEDELDAFVDAATEENRKKTY